MLKTHNIISIDFIHSPLFYIRNMTLFQANTLIHPLLSFHHIDLLKKLVDIWFPPWKYQYKAFKNELDFLKVSRVRDINYFYNFITMLNFHKAMVDKCLFITSSSIIVTYRDLLEYICPCQILLPQSVKKINIKVIA